MLEIAYLEVYVADLAIEALVGSIESTVWNGDAYLCTMQ